MSSSVITPNSEYHMDTSGGDAADPCADIDERSTQEENSPSLTPQKSKEEPISRVHAPQSDQGGSASAMTREDALQTPDCSALVAHSGHIGNASFAIRERVLDDGYNWRKYGQKNVKGNEYVRGYYRCTYPSCQVKKQLDCSSDGKVSDTVYFGHHIHPKPEEDGPLAARFGVATAEVKPDNRSSNKSAEGKSSSQLGQPPRLIELPVKRVLLPSVAESIKVNDIEAARAESTRIRNEADNEDDMDSKRQKKRKCNVEATLVDKHYGEHRAVVHTVSDVDIVNDGYRWRKYGQKMVKGSPHPRSYYRCSNSGCPAKKHVERASHDAKVVVTTYEGTHDHDLPASRTVTPKTAGLNTSPTSHISKTGSKSEERDVHILSKASHSISSPETRTVEPQNGKSVIKLQNTEGLVAGTVSSGSSQEIRPKEDQTEKPGAESKVSEHQSGFSSDKGDVVGSRTSDQSCAGLDSGLSGQDKGDVVGSRTSDQSCAGLDSGLSGQPNVKSRESDVVNTVSIARSADIVGNGNEQERANSEAIKS